MLKQAAFSDNHAFRSLAVKRALFECAREEVRVPGKGSLEGDGGEVLPSMQSVRAHNVHHTLQLLPATGHILQRTDQQHSSCNTALLALHRLRNAHLVGMVRLLVSSFSCPRYRQADNTDTIMSSMPGNSVLRISDLSCSHRPHLPSMGPALLCGLPRLVC